MSSAELRGRAAGRSAPPGAALNTDLVDGIGGMDTNDDLMDALIGEAGDATEDAILDTGLPEDYDPTGGLDDAPSMARAGRVFALGDDGDDAGGAKPATGSTRVGMLPRPPNPQTPIPVPAKVPLVPAAQDAPAAPDAATEEGLEEELREEASDEPAHPTPDQDEEPVRALASVSEELDATLLAELSGSERAVAPSRPEPPLPAAPAATPTPILAAASPPAPSARPEASAAPGEREALALRRPRVSHLSAPLLQVPAARPRPLVLLRPGDAPRSPWVCPLGQAGDAPFWEVLQDLTADLASSAANLLAVFGGSRLDEALRPVIRLLHPHTPLSTACRLHYRDMTDVVEFHVPTAAYDWGDLHGLLLVEAAVRPDGIQPRRLTLLDPTLLLG